MWRQLPEAGCRVDGVAWLNVACSICPVESTPVCVLLLACAVLWAWIEYVAAHGQLHVAATCQASCFVYGCVIVCICWSAAWFLGKVKCYSSVFCGKYSLMCWMGWWQATCSCNKAAVSQGFGGPRSSSSLSCTCTCITNHFFPLTDTAASASAILLQGCNETVSCQVW